MNQDKIEFLHREIQTILDAMAVKEYKKANNKLVIINDIIDELIDTTQDEAMLIEFSKYQIMLEHLQSKLKHAE
ncbi:conserved hypothetical protein [Flavobacterium sp. 9AF]|uniref:hypothetical protein n=1 Tax=Flavobacterium sp. 9AF TaxID=2653142 RepID=UPI0012F3B07F|nr:hypothetical protein [Flavobacterium sp. 9AF]VXC39579.1 conserved hypothetical protein [Flavobacterium sp. 9AF]